MSERRLWPEALAILALGAAFVLAMTAPPDELQGNLQRIMYVHVPSAVMAQYVSFGITALASIVWLLRRRPRWDLLAASSAEVGVFFTGLTLATGMIWGKPVWGVWWTWDPRLVLTALLFFVYLGYLSLRRAVDDPEARAKRSAVLGIVAYALVPLNHLSVTLWRTLHQGPTILQPERPSLDPPMLVALLAGFAAFLTLYAALVRRRYQLARAEAVLEERLVERPLAGAAVGPPQLDWVAERD
ncbi:MAG: cytochrome c biogenesis protein CcsA [Acidimicrobiia bacterium]